MNIDEPNVIELPVCNCRRLRGPSRWRRKEEVIEKDTDDIRELTLDEVFSMFDNVGGFEEDAAGCAQMEKVLELILVHAMACYECHDDMICYDAIGPAWWAVRANGVLDETLVQNIHDEMVSLASTLLYEAEDRKVELTPATSEQLTKISALEKLAEGNRFREKPKEE